MGKEAAGDVRLMAVRDDGGKIVQGEAVIGVVKIWIQILKPSY